MSNRRKKRLIVDLDGCAVDSYGQRICDAAKELYNVDVKPEQFCHYSLTKGTGLTDEMVSGIFSKPGYYRDPEPMPHALEVMRRLYDSGYELHIITARPTDKITRQDTLRWLAKHDVPFDSLVIMAHHGDHKLTADSKARLARKLNAAYAVEDNPFNARAYAEICDTVFLITNNLNKDEKMPRNVVRVFDFLQMESYLNEANAA